MTLHDNTEEQIEMIVNMIKEGHENNIVTLNCMITKYQKLFEKIAESIGDLVESIGSLYASQKSLEERVSELILNLERSPRIGFDIDRKS